MQSIKVELVLYKETKGSIHYKAEHVEGKPLSDAYIRKVHFGDDEPPRTIVVTVEEAK